MASDDLGLPADIDRLRGFLNFAAAHLQRRNLGAVEEALADATRLLEAVSVKVAQRGEQW